MKSNINLFLILIVSVLSFSACKNTNEQPKENTSDPEQEIHTADQMVWLTPQQQEAIGLQLGTIEKRNLSASVKITGQLELPPQYHAVVSTFIGGNAKNIKIIEGDYVKKGQVLTVLEHPDYIALQQKFLELVSSLDYLKEAYQRKKGLYEQQVSSAKEYQKASADYHAAMANYKGLKENIRLLGLDPEVVANGRISSSISVKSPISGYVKAIHISTGQYAAPQTNMFEVINNEHVHADLMVYEKDIYKVKEGQLVNFTVSNIPGKVLQAKVFSIGQNFESNPRAIHVHADIITPKVKLLPGMYVNGRLLLHDVKVKSLPQDAIISEGEKRYIFIQKKEKDNLQHQEGVIAFQLTEVTTGVSDQGFTEINLLEPLSDSTLVVTKGAYYLQADMTKHENGHEH